MIKQFIKILLTLMFVHTLSQAHGFIVDSIDNNDGTMSVIGKFSSGAGLDGAKVEIISLSNDQVLFQKRMTSKGSIRVLVPSEPYAIIVNRGTEDMIKKIGTVTPKNGFKNQIGLRSINLAYYISLFGSLLFLLLTVILVYKRKYKKQYIFT